METVTTDRIEKRVVLKASQSRVWRALTDAEEFGTWFGVALEAPFLPGSRVEGRIKLRGYEHVRMEVVVERMDPEHYFSYRWHPYAIDPDVDYSGEPMTLVEFRLDGNDQQTTLTISESGFDRVPLARRAEAFRMNDNGWGAQARNLERHVTQS